MITRAHVGDWLIVPPDPGHAGDRRGWVVGLLHPDGSPPFRVRWLDDDHESLLVPPSDARMRCPQPGGPRPGDTTCIRRWGAGEWREPGPGAPRDGAPVRAHHGRSS